jgi:hypothetical protein
MVGCYAKNAEYSLPKSRWPSWKNMFHDARYRGCAFQAGDASGVRLRVSDLESIP